MIYLGGELRVKRENIASLACFVCTTITAMIGDDNMHPEWEAAMNRGVGAMTPQQAMDVLYELEIRVEKSGRVTFAPDIDIALLADAVIAGFLDVVEPFIVYSPEKAALVRFTSVDGQKAEPEFLFLNLARWHPLNGVNVAGINL